MSDSKKKPRARKTKSEPNADSISPQPSPETIRVPLPPLSSFDPHRPLHKNKLIESQVAHFKELYEQLPEQHKTIEEHDIKTEGQASNFIREVTARLHTHHGVRRREKVKRAT